MTIQKITRKRMTENGLVTEYPKTSIDQVIEESTGKSLDVKLQEIEAHTGRDFTIEPINLASEITGVLPKTNYELPSANEVTFSDSNFVATNTEDAIKELFQFADSGKEFGATIGFSKEDSYNEMITEYAIIFDSIIKELEAQGIDTTNVDYLAQIPNKITEVASKIIPTSVNKTSKLNVTAPYSLEVPLSNQFKTHQLVSSLIEYIGGGTNVLHYNLNFDNTDEDDFIENVDLNFDGTMSLSNSIIVDMNEDETWEDSNSLYRYEVTKDNFKNIDKVEILPSESDGKRLFVDRNGSYKYVEIDYDSPKNPLEIEGLTNYFTFDESIGNVVDSKGDAIGTTYNNPTRVTGLNGQGYAMSFNGSNQYIDFNTKATSLGVKVIEFQFKPNALTNSDHQMIFSNSAWEANSYGWDCVFSKSGELAIYHRNNSATLNIDVRHTLNSTDSVSVRFEWDGTTNDNGVKLKINDITVKTSKALSTETSAPSKNLRIGKSHHTTSILYLKSTIDNLYFYNKIPIAKDLYESKKWKLESNIQNGSTDNIPNRQLINIPPIPMTIKSGILSENDSGIIYGNTIDLNKYNQIETLNVSVFYKNSKFYTIEEPTYTPDLVNNIARNKTSSSSSDYATGYEVAKAFDGNSSSYWKANSNVNQWLKVDLMKQVVISNFYIITSNAASSHYPLSWRLEASNDNATWATLYSSTQIIFNSAYQRIDFSFENTKKFRYYRLFIVSTTGSQNPEISELGLYQSISNNDGKIIEISSDKIQDYVNQERVTIPSDFYNFFGESVEVLSYHATIPSTNPSLSITANWSPLDELEGDFEVVTLSEDLTPRQLYIEGERGDNYITSAISEGDIILIDVDSIEKLTITATGSGKVFPSIDGGVTWLSFVNNEWITVEDASLGLTFEELNNLTEDDLLTLKGDSDTIRFSYFITKDTEIDHIEMRVKLIGDEQLASTSDFDWEHDTANNKLIYHIKKSGTYSVNTLD